MTFERVRVVHRGSGAGRRDDVVVMVGDRAVGGVQRVTVSHGVDNRPTVVIEAEGVVVEVEPAPEA